LTINVTGILTGCTLALELVAVTVIVKVPAGVPVGGRGGGGGAVEPPPQPMQSSTANAPVVKTQRGICLLDLSQAASRTITSRQMPPTGQARTLKLARGSRRVGPGNSWARAVVDTVIVKKLLEIGFGLKNAVVAPGNPVALKVKLSAKPGCREIVTL
jgi:hypothetical protein